MTDSREETTHKSITHQSCREVELATITITAVAANTILEHSQCSQVYVNRSPVPFPNPVGLKCHHFTEERRRDIEGSNVLPRLKKKKKE